MCSGETMLWVVLGLAFGGLAVVRPYTVARWGEIWDAIGRKPAGRVEPTDAKVYLTRALGALVLAVALVVVASCLS